MSKEIHVVVTYQSSCRNRETGYCQKWKTPTNLQEQKGNQHTVRHTLLIPCMMNHQSIDVRRCCGKQLPLALYRPS